MKVQFVVPRSERLKKHIEFFGFLQMPEKCELDLVLFPNVVSILSISKQTVVNIYGNTVSVKAKPSAKGVQTDISGRLLAPLHFEYRGKCDEFCIVFKPLGIEHFFSRPLTAIAPLPYQSIKPGFADWEDFADDVLSTADRKHQLASIERYLLGKLIDADLDELSTALNLLNDHESSSSIAEIARSAGLSQRKLERLFARHIGCSAATYRRIVRFRQSIGLNISESSSLDLTTVSYQANFADQSYFGKEFRRLSAMSPKEFFRSTWKIPEHGIVWKLR